jgi:predicted PurR-regulated permease PerM
VHPVEIFIVILLAGYLGGMTGMIFAVPAYSMIRIIVKEFFGNYYSGDEVIR